MEIFLPNTLAAAAAAAIINIWLAVRIGRLRLSGKVLHGDDGGGPLTRRMRAQLNFVENTPFLLVLVAVIELAGRGGVWLSALVGVYMLSRIAHGIGMDATEPNKLRAIGVTTTMIVNLVLAIVAILLALRVL